MNGTSRLHGLNPAVIPQIIATAEALELGRADAASRQLGPLLASYPNHPEVLRLQAGILSQFGNHQGALAAMRLAVAGRPDDPLYYNTLGTILGANDDLDGAVDALRRACELQPDLALAWYNLGVMLTHCVRHEEATVVLQKTVALNPKHAEARALLGDMLRMQGRFEEAREQYRRIIAEQPASGTAWWGLANLKVGRFEDNDIQRMHDAIQTPGIGINDLVPLGFALAKALDERDQRAASMSALARANAAARTRGRWSAAEFSTGVSNMLQTFSSRLAVAADNELGHEVIFVVGLPRSGTTLVEQILASHTRVQGAGELPDLPLTLTEESRRRGIAFPGWAAQADASDWVRLGQRYLARTARWQGQPPQFVDKLPSNWMYIGAIRAMLPAARIVVCRRDPLETCFSCYRQLLAGNEYTRTFENLAAYWREFDRSIRFWHAHTPEAVFSHNYEQLTANPEHGIRALLDFCGLPFEDACLRFHETDREVRSPSAAQVKQPLHTDAARAERYGALLDPLRKALGLRPFGG